jgi:hypothetical protein
VKIKPALKALNSSDQKIAGPATPTPSDESGAASKKAIAAKLKPGALDKASKAVRHAQRSSRPASRTEKLICRYCGSDDLAPSFIKRRDARCRACLKKRYGSAAKDKNATRTRKVSAVK